MANFSPAGVIKIGRVPWDSSYTHTRSFASASAQTTAMNAFMTTSLNRSDYTYIRMNNSIRVPFNAEQLYTYNYVMYQNANYGSKWFYAFITEINYLNENTTELVLKLDVMQTWYFDYTLVRGFVEREHVNSDTIGAHLNAEPNMDVQYIIDSFTDNSGINSGGYYAVIKLNQVPVYGDAQLTNTVGSKPRTSQGKVEGVPQGCLVAVFNMYAANGGAEFKKFLQDLTECGAADTITDMYYVSSDVISTTNLSQLQVYAVQQGGTGDYNVALTNFGTAGVSYEFTGGTTTPSNHNHQIPRPTTLNGYTPRNNKLLCYPYCYLEVGDFSGKVQEYRWEYFTLDSNNRAVFLESGAGANDYTMRIAPLNYNGISLTSDATKPMSIDVFEYQAGTKISWPYSAYQTWAAQNALSNQLAIIGGAITAGIGAANMIKTEGERGAMGVLGGAMAIGSVAGNYYKMIRTPNQAKGTSEGGSKMATGYQGSYFACMCLRSEFAQIIDGFFDMYGYQVDSVKIPNRTGRPNWNYIKMRNACHRGNVPADDMATINSIYNNGITFWHTNDIGNYSLNNKLS